MTTSRRDLSQILAQLDAEIDEHERSAEERSNLWRDLVAVKRRLRSGEYGHADFIDRSVFEVKRRTEEYVSYFAGWSEWGRWWAALFRENSLLEGVGEIVDLCPGWAPKVELGLLQSGYRGRVSLLDIDERATTTLRRFLSFLPLPFDVQTVAADVFGERKISAPLVIANHALDDLLFFVAAPRLGLDAEAIFEDEDALARSWAQLLEHRQSLMESFPPKVAEALAGHVAPGGRLLLVSYASNAEKLLGAGEVVAFFDELFLATKAALLSAGLVEEKVVLPLKPDDVAEPDHSAYGAHVLVAVKRAA